MNKVIFIILVILHGIIIPVIGQYLTKDFVYKKIDTTELHLTLFYPGTYSDGKKFPTIILFFGGGWVSGSTRQFEPHAKYFASRGMIAVTADYRIQKRNKSSPFDAVLDAKSAIRYLRQNAEKLGIDKNMIAAGGGSAGGHLAAAADLVPLDNESENRGISCRPNALVLFNPVFNNGPGNYGYDRIGARYMEISPFHNIKKSAAPTIVFFGTKDKLVAVDTAKNYQQVMRSFGNRCDLFLYEGQPHGFFNYKEAGDNKYYWETVKEATIFLQSLGYIPASN